MGIRENELRVGNWVLSPTEGEVQIENGWQIDEGEEVEPIPLTEEWLLKFGYFTQNGAWGTIAVKGYHKNTHQLDLFGNAWVHDREGYMVDLDYVHQLQNLYFALTGEELTIKTIDHK